MIKHVHIENFKCFREFDIELDRFNVLVGPNGAGKTAFLQAVMIAAGACMAPGRSTKERVLSGGLGVVLGREAVWRGSLEADWSIEVSGRDGKAAGGERVLRIAHREGNRNVVECRFIERNCPIPSQRGPGDLITGELCDKVVGKAAAFRFDPRCLKASDNVRENPELAEDGGGLPGFLDGILRRGDQSFSELVREFCSRFSEFTRLEFLLRKGKVLSLCFHTRYGMKLSAGSVSDGTILSLAFLAVCYQPEPPKILLVEEPENGVHPGRLEEIVGTLRHLSEEKGVQVILTTHSPYLLDLVADGEVRVFQKDGEGAVQAKRLSDFDDVEEMKKNFMTGEIWSILAEAQKT